MKVDKYSKDGKVVGQVELPDSVFATEVNDVLIYEYIKAANANLRQGTHAAKERNAVRGGGAKPYKQKGTGRARAGTNRSPIWVGGGVVFGPRPRSYKTAMPKKLKRAAFRSILSLKAKEGKVKVIEDFTLEGKTKEAAAIGKAMSLTKAILVAQGDDSLVKRAMKNIPWFNYNNVQRLSGRDLFYSNEIVITEGAISALENNFTGGAVK
jgi:large subunit ribosomal protein L4